MRHLLLGSALILLAGGCPGTAVSPSDATAGVDGGAAPPVCEDGRDGGLPATFATVSRILGDSCLGTGCHDADRFSPPVMLDLRPGHAYQSLVDQPAVERCDGGAALVRVLPGDPERSFLWQKLTRSPPCSGLQMPLGETPQPLPDCELTLLRQWIAAGAAASP